MSRFVGLALGHPALAGDLLQHVVSGYGSGRAYTKPQVHGLGQRQPLGREERRHLAYALHPSSAVSETDLHTMHVYGMAAIVAACST